MPRLPPPPSLLLRLCTCFLTTTWPSSCRRRRQRKAHPTRLTYMYLTGTLSAMASQKRGRQVLLLLLFLLTCLSQLRCTIASLPPSLPPPLISSDSISSLSPTSSPPICFTSTASASVELPISIALNTLDTVPAQHPAYPRSVEHGHDHAIHTRHCWPVCATICPGTGGGRVAGRPRHRRCRLISGTWCGRQHPWTRLTVHCSIRFRLPVFLP